MERVENAPKPFQFIEISLHGASAVSGATGAIYSMHSTNHRKWLEH